MSLTITKSNSIQTDVKKRSLDQVLHIGPLSLRFITLIIVAAMALFYVAQVTAGATGAYDLRAAQLNADKLKDNLEQLQTDALRLQALDKLSQQGQSAGLVPAH